MSKMGKRFLTAKFAEDADVEGKKHETRSSKSETNSNEKKFKMKEKSTKISDKIVSRKGAKAQRGKSAQEHKA